MKSARIFALICGAMSVLFGLGYLLFPMALLEPSGIKHLPPSGLTDVRATYAGMQVGLGIFVLWGGERRVREALFALVLVFGGIALSRLFGMIVGGTYNAYQGSAFGFELLFCVIAGVLLARLPVAAEE